MVRAFSILFYLLIALVCIWLAVANRDYVTASLAPVDQILELPLFFVGLFGVLIGVLAVAPAAVVKRFVLKRKLSKAHKAIAALEKEREDLAAQLDGLAAQVRPEDKRQEAAQLSGAPAQGMLIGPKTAAGTGPNTSGQGVLPG